MGWGVSRRGGAVKPSLQAHVASKLRDEAAVAKESRKAREEKTGRGNPRGRGRGRGGDGLAPEKP